MTRYLPTTHSDTRFQLKFLPLQMCQDVSGCHVSYVWSPVNSVITVITGEMRCDQWDQTGGNILIQIQDDFTVGLHIFDALSII